MDIGWAIIGVVLLTGAIAFVNKLISNKKRLEDLNSKINTKIGNTEGGSLSRQHEVLEKTIIDKTQDIKESQDKRFNKVQNVVDKINDSVIRTETKYNNLESNQREINDKVQALLANWQSVISENKELRKKIEYLKEENKALVNQNTKLIIKSKDDPEDEWDLEV